MKLNHILFALLLFAALIQPASALFYVDISIDSGTRPYQFNATIHNGSGVITVTDIYLNGNNGTNFADVYFSYQNNTLIPHFLENGTNRVWFNVTASDTSVRMWYGNSTHTSTSNGSQTFLAFCCENNAINAAIFNTSGTPTVSNNILTLNAAGENISTKQTFPNGTAVEFNLTASATNGDFLGGFGAVPFSIVWNPSTDGNRYTVARNGASTVTLIEAYSTARAKYKVFWETTARARYYIDTTLKGTTTTNIPSPPLNASVTATTATSYQIENFFAE